MSSKALVALALTAALLATVPAAQAQTFNTDPNFSFEFSFGNPPPRPLPPRDHYPAPPPRPVTPPPVYRDSGACFYSERNFRGDSFCLDRGDSYDRLPRNLGRIRSVEVFGRARVELCSDSGFYGTCATLRSDASRMPPALDRRVSSVEVY